MMTSQLPIVVAALVFPGGVFALALGLALHGGLISPSFTALLSNGSAILASVNGVRPLLRRR